MIDNKILGVAVLGLGGYVAYKMFRKQGVKEEAAIISKPLPPMPPEDVATEYGQATVDWSARLEGELLPNGDRIFEPLDISARNPLRLYYAIVKKKSTKNNVRLVGVIRKPNRWILDTQVGQIWLYNTLTKREVRLDELMKEKAMTSDAVKATEDTFAGAFVNSCRVNPAYNAWDNAILVSSIPTRDYWTRQMGQCDTKYQTVM